ncbi:hypothetical protein JHE00_08950 [Prauserella sp. ASG 168]|uniref:Uncharacterized protein n=1 Tax=Prauserella cavernicola TaxID=2800127 RepID=A0A934V5C3_9PSEU|nr:hypothetical protein [Prauserella cavernicola]
MKRRWQHCTTRRAGATTFKAASWPKRRKWTTSCNNSSPRSATPRSATCFTGKQRRPRKLSAPPRRPWRSSGRASTPPCNDFKAEQGTSAPTASQERSTPQDIIRNRHGDRYPIEAAPIPERLPPRVRRGEANPRLVAFPELGGRKLGHITPDRDDPWTGEARTELVKRGIPNAVARRLANHVEMKTATMMIRLGERHGRLTLNHAPCGSEPGATGGCHEYLPDILPAGFSLTVLGTDVNGTPFKRTYKGTAP